MLTPARVPNPHSAIRCPQFTIRRPVSFAQHGLRTARTTSVRCLPAAADTGIIFNRSIPARVRYAFIENHTVGLCRGGTSILGVEHLLAACYGLGIDNLEVEVTGAEIPFGDGSARPFVRLFRSAGLQRLARSRAAGVLASPAIVERNGAFVCALPATRPGLNVSYFIRFSEPEVGDQLYSGPVSPAVFAQELASARTFGMWRGPAGMPRWLAGAVRVNDGFSVPRRRRFPDEPVRHKVLDLLGDLALLGRNLCADIFAFRAGHYLHHELVRRMEVEWT